MRKINPTLVSLAYRPKRCEGSVRRGDLGYTIYMPEPKDDPKLESVGVFFPRTGDSLWINYDQLNWMTWDTLPDLRSASQSRP